MYNKMQHLKDKIRKEISRKLNNQGKKEALRKSKDIKRKLFSLPEFKKAKFIMFYASKNGEVETVTNSDIVGRFKEMLIEYQEGPFANYLPYTTKTQKILDRLADLKPKTIAPMHGSTYVGDGESAILDLARAMKDVLAVSD